MCQCVYACAYISPQESLYPQKQTQGGGVGYNNDTGTNLQPQPVHCSREPHPLDPKKKKLKILKSPNLFFWVSFSRAEQAESERERREEEGIGPTSDLTPPTSDRPSPATTTTSPTPSLHDDDVAVEEPLVVLKLCESNQPARRLNFVPTKY